MKRKKELREQGTGRSKEEDEEEKISEEIRKN